jgi:Flp pilus assembly protein TadG
MRSSNRNSKGCSSMWRKLIKGRGQSTVEFALGATLALVVMIVGIQFAIIGQAALAVSQGASALARWAAVNPGGLGTYNSSNVAMPLPTAAENLLSPTITSSTTSGNTTTYDLTVGIASYQGSTTTTTSTPIAAQDRVVISLSLNAAKKIVLPSTTLLGISFPTTLTASESQLYE